MDRTVDKQKIQSAVRDILVAIGENPDREGLKDTPDRVARMFEEITSGYDESVTGHLSKTFEEGGSAIVVERDIDFSSFSLGGNLSWFVFPLCAAGIVFASDKCNLGYKTKALLFTVCFGFSMIFSQIAAFISV